MEDWTKKEEIKIKPNEWESNIIIQEIKEQNEKEKIIRMQLEIYLKGYEKEIRKKVCDEIRHKYNYVLYDDTYEFDEITGRQIPTYKMFPYCLTDEDLEELEQGDQDGTGNNQ